MRHGVSRRLRLPALMVLAGWIWMCGCASIAEAQLFPNHPIKRQRPPSTEEIPLYKQYRATYYGYHPTCWRNFTPGWGCPSPNKANPEEEFRKLPAVPPELTKDEEEGMDKEKTNGDEKDQGAMPSDEKKDAGLPSLPGDDLLNEKKDDNAAGGLPGALPDNNATPPANNGDADKQTFGLPPLPPQLRGNAAGSALDILPPPNPNAGLVNSNFGSLPVVNLPPLPPENPAPGQPAVVPMPVASSRSVPTSRDRGLQPAATDFNANNFDYHAGQRPAPRFQNASQPQIQQARKPGLIKGLFQRFDRKTR